MDKKNYNLEVYFESQNKSFVILSKNKITFDELKQKTIREFHIPKEYEKDMRFIIKIRNIPITLTNDVQILKNFEEISKNNYYLKIIFNLNNNNYIYHSSKIPLKKANSKIRTHLVNYFSIISDVKKNNNFNEDKENKYIEEIKNLKDEIEKLKSEKTNKGEIDIRKFDEKYRELSNKNNNLEQKIIELENENKTLKNGLNKNTISDNLLTETNYENDSLIKEIEKIFTKFITEHDNNIIKEITGLKNSIDSIKNEQKIFYDKFNKIDNNFELLKDDKIFNFDHNEDIRNNTIEEKKNNSEDKKINENTNKNNINNSNEIDNDNYKDLNLANIIIEQKSNDTQNSVNKNKETINELDSNDSKCIKRTINIFEDEKNSKSNNNSKNKIQNNSPNNLIKEIKNSFLENNNIDKFINKMKSKRDLNDKEKKNYSKYTAPSKKKIIEKMRVKNKKNIFNNSTINKEKSEEDLNNYESSSEINSETKKMQNDDKEITINSQKNFVIKMNSRKKSEINKISQFTLNEKNMTPTGINISERGEKKSFKQKQINITPTGKENTVKENIEDYFLNLFQNIFFYGNNGYLNLLKISDKTLKKLREGIGKFRMNISEIREYCTKYISFSIVPIVNDSNTKEYQRKIIKDKIATILETLRIDKKYFDKDYKELNEDKKEKGFDEHSINGLNITHNKINEFRKFYELKEKDYPDELIIKALIRYRGNRELAFQYLFY